MLNWRRHAISRKRRRRWWRPGHHKRRTKLAAGAVAVDEMDGAHATSRLSRSLSFVAVNERTSSSANDDDDEKQQESDDLLKGKRICETKSCESGDNSSQAAAAAAAATTTTTVAAAISPAKGRRKHENFQVLPHLVLMCLIICIGQELLAPRGGTNKWLPSYDSHNNKNDNDNNNKREDTQAENGNLGERSSSRPRLGLGGNLVLFARADSDANRLYEDLMMTYNRIVRPVQNESDRVVVRLGLKLSQLMDVNLKNQMMTINVWLNQEWSDYKLKWDPSEYGGIQDINLPAEQIWLPDIVLYNSAEGYFAVSIMTKAKVRFDGYVIWNPPAIFRSSCQIDITHFPFDSQDCHLKFGSWTFGTKIDLRHINETEGTIERGTDLSEYYQNVEWDIMQASAIRNVIKYECCPNDFYPDVTFHFKLRRKPLFYTVNLILPCVGITFFSFLVFYLPSDSGEKVTLTISILVSLIFFLSVLIETIPSTSVAMPLLGKYLVFTMILITMSVCATVCVLNIHFRTPSTHSMPPWVKRWCMDVLPKYLFMSVPQYQSQQANILPEQLIYLHNQAYTNQAVIIPGQPSTSISIQRGLNDIKQRENVDPNTHYSHETTLINGSSSNLAAGHHFHSSDQCAPMQTNQTLSHLSQQQMPLNVTDLIASNTLQSRPKTFLPYLQSEAARRLQVQRSRSSDRDNKSTSDNQQTASGTSTNNGGKSSCDNKTSRSENKNLQQLAQERGNSSTRQLASATVRQSATKSKNSSSKPFWRLFKSNKANGSNDEQEQVPPVAEQRRLRASSPSTSSSVEGADDDDDDYKHHRHFQARASICSNNLWRIGPTRRCSLAVPSVNYPSYYRPLAQLQHAHTSGPAGKTPLSTISGGCLPPIPAHYHTHNEESSASSNDTSSYRCGQAIGTLIGAAATNIVSHPRQVYDLHRSVLNSHEREMEPMTSGGFIRSDVQNPNPVDAIPPRLVATPSSYQSTDTQNTMPTPPPPLPPDFNDNFSHHDRLTGTHPTRTMLQQHQQQQQQQQSIRNHPLNDNWQSALGNAVLNNTMAHLDRESSTSTATNTTAQYRQMIPVMQQVPQYLTMAGSSRQMRPQENAAIMLQDEPRSHLNNTTLMDMPEGYYANNHARANIIAQQQQQRAVPSTNQSFSGVDYQPSQYLNADQHLIPRSRSTDHRLFAMPRDVSTNSLLSCTQGGGNMYMKQQLYHVGHQRPVFGQSTASIQGTRQQESTQPLHQQRNQQQSIGRQLGQAYIQKLQRQPTVHSIHHSRQLPAYVQQGPTTSLGASRGRTDEQARNHQLVKLDDCQLQHYHEPSIDMLRRSKSQTSLNRRAQVGCSASVDRRNCMGERMGDYGGMAANHHSMIMREPVTRMLSRPQSELRGRINSMGCREYNNTVCKFTQSCHPMRGCNDVPVEPALSYGAASLMRTMSTDKAKNYTNKDMNSCRCSALEVRPIVSNTQQLHVAQLSTLSMLKLINEVDRAIQNAMFIAQHIDNLDEFESVKENWKYIAMVIDRIFLIIFLFVCIFGTVAIFALVPWSYYLNEKPIDLQLTRLIALNLTSGEALNQGCHEF